MFSANGLADTVPYQGVRSLIGSKDAEYFISDNIEKLSSFLLIHGFREPTDLQSGDLPRSWWYFKGSENRVALSTLDSIITSVSKDIYGLQD